MLKQETFSCQREGGRRGIVPNTSFHESTLDFRRQWKTYNLDQVYVGNGSVSYINLGVVDISYLQKYKHTCLMIMTFNTGNYFSGDYHCLFCLARSKTSIPYCCLHRCDYACQKWGNVNVSLKLNANPFLS